MSGHSSGSAARSTSIGVGHGEEEGDQNDEFAREAEGPEHEVDDQGLWRHSRSVMRTLRYRKAEPAT